MEELADLDRDLRALCPDKEDNRCLVKSLIQKTWESRNEAFERAVTKGAEDAKELWSKYPHLKDPALVSRITEIDLK